MSQYKKPFYKKLWFILFSIFVLFPVVITLISVIINPSLPDEEIEKPETSKQEEIEESQVQDVPNVESKMELLIETIDIDQLNQDLADEFINSEFFPYVRDVSIAFNNKDTITLMAIVRDSTSPEVAAEFADTFIRQCNSFAALQNSDIAMSSDKYYGGLYDDCNLFIGIASNSKLNDYDDWFVYQAITKGRYIEIKLNKAYQ